MALPNGDLITTPFDPQMAYPQDRRMQVDTLNSRDSISMFIRWEGMTVYVLEDSKIYILQGGRSNEFWKELGTGSGTGGTTFVGQFASSDLLPTTGRSPGDYAFVGTGDDFVQYNWDNISNQWVMAEGQTDMASEFFHIGYKTPLRRPVIFPLFPKDVLVQESGDFVFAPETAVARFIFTGEVTAIRGIETAAADREIKLVNRTGSDIPLRDKASGIPSGSGFDFGGTDYTWVNGSEITLKGNGAYWELAPNNQVAFSDHLDSVNAEVSFDSDGLMIIENILDNQTKEYFTLKETTTFIDGSPISDTKLGKFYKKIGDTYLVDTRLKSGVIINVGHYAVGDDIVDDTENIRSAITEGSKFSRPTLIFPVGYIYRVSDTITIPYACNIIMDSPIKWYGGGEKTAMYVGASGVRLEYLYMSFRVVSEAVSSWGNDLNIGVLVRHSMFNEIHTKNIQGFARGFRAFVSGNDGWAWNKIFVNEIFNCGIALDLFSTGTGWINENSWDMVGRVSALSTYNSRTRYDVRIISSTGYAHNGNIFLKPSSESVSENYIPFLIESGSSNTFEDIRFESNYNGGVVAIINSGDRNVFSVAGISVSTPSITDNTPRKKNYLTTREQYAISNNNCIYSSGYLPDKTKSYDATKVNIRGIDCFYYTDTVGKAFSSVTNQTRLRTNCIELTGTLEMVSVMVDTLNVREFVFKVNLIESTRCRHYFVCYDASGNQITTGTPVNGLIADQYSYNASVAGGSWWRATASTNGVERIYFDASVVKVRFMIGKDTAYACKFDTFSIHTVNRTAINRTSSVWSEASPESHNISTLSPTTGVGKLGEMVLNSAYPSSSNIIGWKCTVSGNPGTWVEHEKTAPYAPKPNYPTATQNHSVNTAVWSNNFMILTSIAGTATVSPDFFATGDEIVGIVMGGAKTFVGASGMTIRIPSGGSNVVNQYERFALKFLSPTEAVLTIVKPPVTAPNASTTQRGIIEQATDAEIKTGTDTERAIDPKGLKDNYLSFTEREINSTGTVAITPLTYNIKQEKITFTGTGTVTLNGFSDVISDRTLILINKTGNDLTIVNGASVTVPFSGAFVIPDNQSARFQVYSNLILKEL